MSNDKDTEDSGRSINRRTVLKGAAAGSAVGMVGIPTISGTALAGEAPPEVETCGDLDIVCAIDTSGSLSSSEISNLQSGVNSFIDELPTDGSVMVGSLEFGNGGIRDKNDLRAPGNLTVDLPSSGSGNTPMPGAMDIADQAVYNDSTARSDAIKLVVLFTDGGPNYTNTSYTEDYTAPRDDSADWSATSGDSTYDNADTASATVSKGEMDETALVAGSVKDGSIGGGATLIATVYVGDDDTEAMTSGALSTYTDLPTYLETNIASSGDFAIDVEIANIEALVGELVAILEDLCCPDQTLDLCAAQDIDVGTVTVSESEGELSIIFDLDDPWILCESHVDIGDDKEDLHPNKAGNPQVGQFDLTAEYDPCVSEFPYTAYTVECGDDALSDVPNDAESLLIAVHAVVKKTSENLVTNGGFEEPEIEHNLHWNVFGASTDPTLPGWDVEWTGTTTSYGGLTRPEPQLEIQEEGIDLGTGASQTADEGDQWAELDTDWDGPDGSVTGEPSNVSISQDVETSGTFYKLSYAYSPRPGVEDNFLEVFWDGEQINSHTADGSGNSTTDWTTVEMLVESSSDETELAFAEKLEETAEADSLGMFLDDVRLVEIREETAWVCEGQDGVERFVDRGNWATYFTYELCGAGGLDCNSE